MLHANKRLSRRRVLAGAMRSAECAAAALAGVTSVPRSSAVQAVPPAIAPIPADAFRPWVSGGLVSTRLGQGTNNGVAYTAQALVLLELHGNRPRETSKDLLDALDRCQVVRNGQRLRGLYGRHVDVAGDLEAIDDYLCLASVSAVLQLPYIARDIIAWGRGHSWLFDNKSPDSPSYKSYMGPLRYPALYCALHWAAGEKLPARPDYGPLWGAALRISADKDPREQDAFVQSWLLIQAYYRTASELRREDATGAVGYWWKRFHDRGLSMGKIVRAYLSQPASEPPHPLSLFWDDFER